MTRKRCYSEMLEFPSFEERFEYLKLGGKFGTMTFGSSRYLNQRFYTSREWRDIRNFVIVRDMGCDLAVDGLDINSTIFIHHIDPLTRDLVSNHDPSILDPENLVCVCYNTHKAIHYGSFDIIELARPIERTPNDTCPWKGAAHG